MILRTWSVNPDGVVLESSEIEVRDLAEASATLAYDLASSASDLFTHNALTEWFTAGKISMLSEHVNDISFWNAELLDVVEGN